MLYFLIADVSSRASKYHYRKSKKYNTTSRAYKRHAKMIAYYNQILQISLSVINFEIKLEEINDGRKDYELRRGY